MIGKCIYVILSGAFTIKALTSGLNIASHNLSTTINEIIKSAIPTKNTAQKDPLIKYAENFVNISESSTKVWVYVLKT